MKLKLSVIVLLLPFFLAAQDDVALYMKQAGGAAMLYRGYKAYTYPMAFNGTNYWDGPSFSQGEVLYNGKTYGNLLLNVDASRQDLLVKTPSGSSEKVLSRDLVTQFTMDGRRFLNLQKVYGPAVPDGYWEVIYDGQAKVVRQVRRNLRQDLDGTFRMQIGYDISTYRSNVYQTFLFEEVFCYVGEDGSISPIRRRSQLLKFYKDRKREINRHISRQEAGGRLDFASFCKAVLSYAESR